MRPVQSHTKPEADRRSRVAYQAWVDACARVGAFVTREWEALLDDEQYCWRLVYDDCAADAQVQGGAEEAR